MSKKVIGAKYINWFGTTFGIRPAETIFEHWDGKTWQSEFDLRIQIQWSDGTTSCLLIPKGTKTDGSSVPFPLNALIPAIGPNIYAALPHDEIFRNKDIHITCGQADDIYYYLALEKKAMAYAGLRLWNFLFKTNPNYVERA